MSLSGADKTPWYQSKTIIAILVGVIAKIGALWLGYEMDLKQLSDLSDYLAIALPVGATFLTDIVAIWGRVSAKYKIGK